MLLHGSELASFCPATQVLRVGIFGFRSGWRFALTHLVVLYERTKDFNIVASEGESASETPIAMATVSSNLGTTIQFQAV